MEILEILNITILLPNNNITNIILEILNITILLPNNNITIIIL